MYFRKAFFLNNFLIFYRMLTQGSECQQLTIVDSTCTLSKPLNRYCAFDGSHFMYLTGAHIVCHNVFQNNKHFIQRANQYPVTSFAAHKGNQTTILFTTKAPFCQVQFYFWGKKAIIIETGQDWQIIDALLIQKKRAFLLGKKKNRHVIMVINSHHSKIKTIDIAQSTLKLLLCDRYALVLTGRGYYQFDIDAQFLNTTKKYSQFSFEDLLVMENGSELLISKSQAHLMVEGKHQRSFQFSNFFNGQNVQYQGGVRLGNKIVLVFKNSLTLNNFQLTNEGNLQLMETYQYSQKLKGTIVGVQSSSDQMNIAIAFRSACKENFQIEYFMFNTAALSRDKKFVNPFYRLASAGIQHGQITCLQKIISSQIYALAGSHIVNYVYGEHVDKKYKYTIHQSPRIVTVHSLGHQLMCAFDKTIKFYQKVQMELVEVWSQNIQCSAARYTSSGLLLLCVYEDNSHNMLIYNPNSFCRLRSFSNVYLKHSVWKISFNQSQTDMILYSQKDVFVHRIKTGQRISEFREKKEMIEANCVKYDSANKMILAACGKDLIVFQKTEDYCVNFAHQQKIHIGEEVTSLLINQTLQVLFMGTIDGKVILTQYPLFNLEDGQLRILKQVRVQNEPITDLLLTNNQKFLLCRHKGQGLTTLKAKWSSTHGNYNPFDISNYNFIQASSTPYLQSVQQKLKNLLERRKTIFNELQEFKKEWQVRRIKETRAFTLANKRKELSQINETLGQIALRKAEKNKLVQDLAAFQIDRQKNYADAEKNHQKDLLKHYAQSDSLGGRLEELHQRCQNEYSSLKEECQGNLQEIKIQLQNKFKVFSDNYQMMRINLKAHRMRIDFQHEQDEIVRQNEVKQMREVLQNEQVELHRKCNQLKGQITRGKRELARYQQRKDFLNNKKKFFLQQLIFSGQQEKELGGVKETLLNQLQEIEQITHNKEERLRKYFFENKALTKYQIIYDSLSKQGTREIQFMDKQKQALSRQITDLQQEILQLAQQREQRQQAIVLKQKDFTQIKMNNKALQERSSDLWVLVGQIESTIAQVQGQSNNIQFRKIYKRWFTDKGLDGLLQHENINDRQDANKQKIKNELGVQGQLQSQKQYLKTNLKLFQKYNTKTIEEIHLTNLKYQTQNYNLISQCNLRKDQIQKHKKVLHQLADSYRQNTNALKQMQNNQNRPKTALKQTQSQELPFTLFQRTKQSIKVQDYEGTKTPPNQYRRMLQISRCVRNSQGKGRRIQTATLKNKPKVQGQEQQKQDDSMMNEWWLQKPKTACQGRRVKNSSSAQSLLCRKKTTSKPTTCTTHSKSKQSMFF